MSRVRGYVTTQELLPCGRLCLLSGLDSAEKIMEFACPSFSRPIVYGIELDLLTSEIACPCEALDTYRETRKSPYRWQDSATPNEVLARSIGKRLLPCLDRAPRNLCPHARRVRSLMRKRGLWHVIEDAQKWTEKKLDEAIRNKKALT